jgi:hypothetical protein
MSDRLPPAPQLPLPRRSKKYVRWGDLCCPKEPGIYDYGGLSVRVNRMHIEVAEGDPEAVFSLTCFDPGDGTVMCTLGAIDTSA